MKRELEKRKWGKEERKIKTKARKTPMRTKPGQQGGDRNGE